MSDPQALECYRRALYLEPEHYESLLQMAILSQRAGQIAIAQVFRARAQRLKSGPNPT
jgi:chemotaxis protein methyltransferase WspC